MTIRELLLGKKVRATKDCYGVIKDNVYKVKMDTTFYIGENYLSGCTCISSWELLEEIHFIPTHEHKFTCECGWEYPEEK